MPTVKKVIWKFDGISNAEELHHRLQYFMLRRTKLDVAMELPPKTRQIIDIDVAAKHKVKFSEKMFQNKAALRKSLDLAADGALKPAIEMILNDLVEGANEVVFTHRKAVAEHVVDVVSAAKFPCGFIHSGVSTKKREQLIAEAKVATGPFLIAATIDSTSTGIDLSFANVATVIELPYEWHTLAQAEGRLHRYGQERPVLVRYVVARGTSAELILQAVLRKVDAFEKVVGKLDDKLGQELDSAPKGDAALQQLYESIVKQQAEDQAAAEKYAKKQADKKAKGNVAR